jgi:hypothetical protein
VDGVTEIFTVAEVNADSSGNGTYFYYFDQQNERYLYFTVNGQAVGNYDGTAGNLIETIHHGQNNWDLSSGQSFDNCQISAYGNTGEPIIGTFGGTLVNYGVQPPQTVTVSGDFNIIRSF